MLPSSDYGNIPVSVFDDAAHFSEKRAVRGVVSLERGAERGDHIQGVMTLGTVKGNNDRELNTRLPQFDENVRLLDSRCWLQDRREATRE